MVRLLLKIPRITFMLLLMLFALSSNKHVLDYCLESFKSDYSCVIENDIEGEKDTADKSGEDKKDKNDYYYNIDIEFSFAALVKQKLESLHLERSKMFISKPLSPPPEQIFA